MFALGFSSAIAIEIVGLVAALVWTFHRKEDLADLPKTVPTPGPFG